MTPTFDDIKKLATIEPILHHCYVLLERGKISPEQFFCLCIETYVEENRKLRTELFDQCREQMQLLQLPVLQPDERGEL